MKNATHKSVIFLKNASGSFFWFDAPRQKLSDQWDWRFCSRVWSSWSYSKTQLGGAQTQNVAGYSRKPCSLNRERDAAWLHASGTPTARPMSETHIESRQFIGWWRDAVSDAITSSAHTGERAIHSSDFSAEKIPVGSVRSLAANAASHSLFRELGLRE